MRNVTERTSRFLRRGTPVTITIALIIDAVAVLGFAASGRSQHGENLTLAGLWETAWPFLFALAFTWAVAAIWQRPLAVLRAGLPVWLGTVAFGMVMRVAFTDGGAALPFVFVATGTLGMLIVGWRFLARLLFGLTDRPGHSG